MIHSYSDNFKKITPAHYTNNLPSASRQHRGAFCISVAVERPGRREEKRPFQGNAATTEREAKARG